MKAFAYLQVSDNGQIEGDGFPRLLEAIKGYAAAHGFSIVMVYCEEGVTGALEGMSRPDLLQMT